MCDERFFRFAPRRYLKRVWRCNLILRLMLSVYYTVIGYHHTFGKSFIGNCSASHSQTITAGAAVGWQSVVLETRRDLAWKQASRQVTNCKWPYTSSYWVYLWIKTMSWTTSLSFLSRMTFVGRLCYLMTVTLCNCFMDWLVDWLRKLL